MIRTSISTRKGSTRAWRLLLVAGASLCIRSCWAQPITVSEPETTCEIVRISPFQAFIRPPEPTCSAADNEVPHPEQFLSFEEWKSLRLAETPPPEPTPPQPEEVLSPITPAASPITETLRVPLTDRFNYASSDCSARIHSNHKSSKSPHFILSHKRDRYMLSPCSTPDKFVVIELCEDVQVDTIQLANFEFFSGVFKDIRVSLAKTYDDPTERWVVAGTYRAKNTRNVQSFQTIQDFKFYRYVRIDFLSHYGGEYYCPVSLLRVYGLTEMEEYKWDEWRAEQLGAKEREMSLLRLEADPQHVRVARVEPVNPPRSEESRTKASEAVLIVTELAVPTVTSASALPVVTEHPISGVGEGSTQSDASSSDANIHPSSTPPTPEQIDEIVDNIMANDLVVEESPAVTNVTPAETSVVATSRSPAVLSLTSPLSQPAESVLTLAAPPNSEVAGDALEIAMSQATARDNSSPSDLPSTSSSIPPKESPVLTPTLTSTSISTASAKPTIVHSTIQSPRYAPPPVPSSTTGESIYRTIMNRLGVLESNSSLGVKYIEDTSRSLRAALRRLEEDVSRLEKISNSQQQALRKTLTEVQQQKKDMELERSAHLSQIRALAEEITLEKRLGIAQLCLLLMVLVFMTFTRGASHSNQFLEGISVPGGVIATARRKGSQWRRSGVWKSMENHNGPNREEVSNKWPDPGVSRAIPKGEPRPGRTPLNLTNKSTPSLAPSHFPRTPNPRSPPGSSRSVDIQSFPSPFVEGLVGSKRSPQPFMRSPHLVAATLDFTPHRSHSQPNVVPKEILTPKSVNTTHPVSVSHKALGKTAHLHEVGSYRRRRVSSKSQGAADDANAVISIAGEKAQTNGEVRDVYIGESSTHSSRSRSRSVVRESDASRRRGSKGKEKDLENILTLPSANRTPVKNGKRPSVQSGGESEAGLTTPSGSDVWEDTSDPGDDGDDEDVLHSRDTTVTLGSSKHSDDEGGYSSEDLPSSTRGGTPLAFVASPSPPSKFMDVGRGTQPHVYPEPLKYA